jgi:membrane protease YdiL (CAAX protease family)
VFLLVLLGFFYLGTPLQLQDTRTGLVLTQLFIIAGIPIVALRFWGIPILKNLGLNRVPGPAVLVLVLVAAPAATMIAALVGMAQGTFMEVPESYRELMEKLFQSQGGVGFTTALVSFAVIPGLCEEIFFRGFVLRGLARRMPPAAAIVWTAVLFGAFHFDLYRLLPTTVLGLILGTVVWLTGSLWPAILLHVANNAIAVSANNVDALKQVPWLQEGAAIPLEVVLAVGVLGAAGVWGIVRLTGGPRGLRLPEPEQETAGEPAIRN